MKHPLYSVRVWDHEQNEWACWFEYFNGPFKLFGLRKILRELFARGYDTCSIWVERIGWEKEYATKQH